MGNLLGIPTIGSLSLPALAFNLVLSLALSTGVAWFYTRFGRALSNRARFAQTLPILAVTTALVISIIRGSVALSLGLVGALSIVRFRTAIKDPEELLYLFVSIAIGLGIGADEQLPTILAVLIILGYVALRRYVANGPLDSNLYVNILAPNPSGSFAAINDVLRKHTASANLRRLDSRAASIEVTYLIQCPGDHVLTQLMDDLRSSLPEGEFSFVEQDNALAG